MQRFRERNIFKQHIFAIEIEVQTLSFLSEFSAFDAQCSARAVEGRNKNHFARKIFVIVNSFAIFAFF